MVVVAWLTQVLGSVHSTTLPASTRLAVLDLHPVWLVVLVVLTSASDVTVADVGRNQVWVLHRTRALKDRLLHVEDVHTFQLTQVLESLQTGGLVKIGWDGAGLGTWTDQRVGASDIGQGVGGLGLNLSLGQESGGGKQSGLSSSASECTGKPVC